MDTTLQSRIADFFWHHSINFGNGLITPGAKPLNICQTEANIIFDRINLNGCSVLDIGAWNGLFSFEAKQRGAERVLATDSYCWTHPNFKGYETFQLARSALNLEIDTQEIDVADLSPTTVGEFDVVMYLGVFYHRYDTIEALAKVASLAKKVLIVETQLALRDLKEPAMLFYPGKELNNDPTNWWGPNEHCIKALLTHHGFTEIEISAHPFAKGRAIFHAWRTTDIRTKTLEKKNQLRPFVKPKLVSIHLKFFKAAYKFFRRIFSAAKNN